MILKTQQIIKYKAHLRGYIHKKYQMSKCALRKPQRRASGTLIVLPLVISFKKKSFFVK